VAGRRPYPLVCVVELAGLDLPLLVLHRERERDGDRLRWRTADRAFARTVVESEEVFAFLGEALPAYADLVLERDTIAMTTVPSVDPEPWRADAMLACLLGLLDRLPAEILPEHSTTPPQA
jgi:hypothetical protein